MKQITRDEAQQLFEDWGHHMHVSVPAFEHGEETWRTVLNNAMVYNPIPDAKYRQIGMASNKENAISAMKFINDRFKVVSTVFQFTTGEYQII